MNIGRYIIRGMLGRGGMGKVYKVELPVIHRIAALKLLDPDPLLTSMLGRQKLHDLFVAEARTMAGLHHPNIVGVHDFDQVEGKLFFVMDYYADSLGAMIGESYRVENPSRRLTVDKVLDYTRQTLEGIACLHEAGIVHRDIKPFNLLITARDTIKICDFGLSKLRGEIFAGPTNLNVGSPFYAAPEQEIDPDKVDQRADLYPIGIMLYRMLTGHLPEHPPHDRKYRPPSRLHPDLDTVWDDFIAQAAAHSPHERFDDARDMLKSLEDLERHWQACKENTCTPAAPVQPLRAAFTPDLPLRTTPIKAPPRHAAECFALDDLWRPAAYIDNVFMLQTPDLVLDQATGLVWQRSGSRYPLDWRQAQCWVERLNDTKFRGRQNWRLPTIDELISLLHPPRKAAELCIAPLFDTLQRRLWSADRKSFTAAYVVDVEMGFVAWQDFSAPYYVRAVSSV